jgi:hypothetical protein
MNRVLFAANLRVSLVRRVFQRACNTVITSTQKTRNAISVLSRQMHILRETAWRTFRKQDAIFRDAFDCRRRMAVVGENDVTIAC